jgi:uroporphyrinogen decarboxylase
VGITGNNFIDACYGRNTGRIPIWIMRQAGRYLPEYRTMREKVSFLELCRSPKMIAEVVKQPIDRFDLDAAILFSDILTVLPPMGITIEFPNGGPIISPPIESDEDVDRLKDYDAAGELHFVYDGIREIKKVLPNKPLIGFAGSPFTLACYLIEGQGSKNFSEAKRFLHRYPDASKKLIDMLTDITSRYLATQIDAGADTVKVFESWGGILSQSDFRQWCADPIDRIFRSIVSKDVPRILFVNNVSPYLPLVRDIDCEVIGVDYRIDIADAARAIPDKAIQGNLDPAVLFGLPENAADITRRILDSIDNHDRLIFNLGHGIFPETPIESVQAMVDAVHSYRIS